MPIGYLFNNKMGGRIMEIFVPDNATIGDVILAVLGASIDGETSVKDCDNNIDLHVDIGTKWAELMVDKDIWNNTV